MYRERVGNERCLGAPRGTNLASDKQRTNEAVVFRRPIEDCAIHAVRRRLTPDFASCAIDTNRVSLGTEECVGAIA